MIKEDQIMMYCNDRDFLEFMSILNENVSLLIGIKIRKNYRLFVGVQLLKIAKKEKGYA